MILRAAALAVVAAATTLMVACGTHTGINENANATPLADIEQDRPACADRWVINKADYFDHGRPPEAHSDPARRFLYEMSDSSWCAEATADDLVGAARGVVLLFPELCDSQRPGLPSQQMRAYVDSRTSGGPVSSAMSGMELGLGRGAAYLRFLTAAADLACPARPG